VLAVGGYLLYALVFSDSLTYYYTVSELMEQAEAKYDQSVRVSGEVVEGSVDWNADDIVLSFEIGDGSGTLPAVYRHSMPDGFTEGKGVLLEGKYRSDGVFHASKIMMSCPSKYESGN